LQNSIQIKVLVRFGPPLLKRRRRSVNCRSPAADSARGMGFGPLRLLRCKTETKVGKKRVGHWDRTQDFLNRNREVEPLRCDWFSEEIQFTVKVKHLNELLKFRDRLNRTNLRQDDQTIVNSRDNRGGSRGARLTGSLPWTLDTLASKYRSRTRRKQ
jgi:hypothetical protein